MYAQIGSISLHHLPQAQIDWLEAQDPFYFAAIIDGDESEPLEIEMRAMDFDSVIVEAQEGQRILVDNQSISCCPELGEKDSYKSYWGGETIFVL